MWISDVKSDKIGKNAVDRFSIEVLSNRRQSRRGGGWAVEIHSALTAFEWIFACWPLHLLNHLFFFSSLISLLVPNIFAFKVEKIVIWRPPSWYANEGGGEMSKLQEWKLKKYHFVPDFWNIERNFIGCQESLMQCILTSFAIATISSI